MHKSILVPALVAGMAFAAPTAPRHVRHAGRRNTKRDPTRVQLDKRATCTFTTYAEVSASQAACTEIVLDNIAVPAGETLALTKLTEGTTVTFEGTTTFGYEEWAGPLIEVSGTSITVTAATGAVIDFGGASWWDGEGSNGGKTKPAAFYAHSLTDSTIEKLSVLNTPVQFMSVDDATSLDLLDITQNNAAGTTSGLAANTDGFDIASSTDVYISGAVITNQDDCVAINSGTSITFTGGTCTGGHGLSIGSVGGRDDNTVEDVLFESSKVVDSMNGVRIKTVYDATGSVAGCEYKDITLSGITEYGIVIEQDYENGDPTGTPTNGVTISGLILDGITGTVDSTAYNYYILCGDGSCTDWTWDDVDVTGGKTDDDCENVPSVATCS